MDPVVRDAAFFKEEIFAYRVGVFASVFAVIVAIAGFSMVSMVIPDDDVSGILISICIGIVIYGLIMCVCYARKLLVARKGLKQLQQ